MSLASKNVLRSNCAFKNALTLAQARPSCSWLEVDVSELKGTFKQVPERTDLPPDINEKLIVELYSK